MNCSVCRLIDRPNPANQKGSPNVSLFTPRLGQFALVFRHVNPHAWNMCSATRRTTACQCIPSPHLLAVCQARPPPPSPFATPIGVLLATSNARLLVGIHSSQSAANDLILGGSWLSLSAPPPGLLRSLGGSFPSGTVIYYLATGRGGFWLEVVVAHSS